MSVFRFLLVAMILGDAVAGARGQASATNYLGYGVQETFGESYKITQRLVNKTAEPWYTGWDFYKLDIAENLSNIGCVNITNSIGWIYEATSSETCRLENSLPSVDHRTNSAKNYFYEVPTNLVDGWEFVTATFTANNGDIWLTIPRLWREGLLTEDHMRNMTEESLDMINRIKERESEET